MFMRTVTTAVLFAGVIMNLGCGAPAQKRTGFLSDYSNLEERSSTSFRYLAGDNRLGEFDRFMIDPIKVYYHGGLAQLKASQVEELAKRTALQLLVCPNPHLDDPHYQIGGCRL